MNDWLKGDILILRNIARSDGMVTAAIPARCLEDSEKYLAVYIAKGTPFRDNYAVASDKRVAAVESSATSTQRFYKVLAWWQGTVRLYLPYTCYSVWFFYNEQGAFSSYYGNLEAPFARTPIGTDTRDYALDVVADAQGQWHW